MECSHNVPFMHPLKKNKQVLYIKTTSHPLAVEFAVKQPLFCLFMVDAIGFEPMFVTSGQSHGHSPEESLHASICGQEWSRTTLAGFSVRCIHHVCHLSVCDVLFGGVRHLTLHFGHLTFCPPAVGYCAHDATENKCKHTLII